MIVGFGDLYPPSPAESIAERALMMSRRRRIAFYIRAALGVAMAAAIGFVFISRLFPAPKRARVTTISETFRLQCLSPEQALEVLRPHRSPQVGISANTSSPLGIIRVVAPPEEMEQMRSLLDRYDNPKVSQCGVRLTVPKDNP